MNLRIVNDYGYSLEFGGKSGLKLLDYPDFGSPQADFYTDKIPEKDGEILRSTVMGTRDIFIKAEAGLPMCYISRILVPGGKIHLYVDDKWLIEGHITGIKEIRRPARLALPVMNVGIRCFIPFFSKVNAESQIKFENHGGGIYETGDYTCTKLTVINEGDVPCPISVTMCSNAASASTPAGLFNSLSWNDGAPLYTGIVFKKGTVRNKQFYITTDTSSDRFFESREVLDDCDYFFLPPGKTELYAQNVTGELTFSPRFLYVDGRDV